MQEKKFISINPITVGLVLLQIVFVVFMVISFQDLFNSEVARPVMDAPGLNDEIDDLPENGKQAIENAVYKAVADNATNNNIDRAAMEIRDGTMIAKYLERVNVHYVNFVADLPDIKQSYRVYYEWSDDAFNRFISPNFSTAVFCLEKDELIYDDFECELDNEKTKNFVISNLFFRLGNTVPGVDGLQVTSENTTDKSGYKIRLNYISCESQCNCMKVGDAEKRLAIDGFEKNIKDAGFKPKDINYYFSNCENIE